MEILQNDPNVRGIDGVYTIKIGDQKKKIFCDMTRDGGGWTVSTQKPGKLTRRIPTKLLLRTSTVPVGTKYLCLLSLAEKKNWVGLSDFFSLYFFFILQVSEFGFLEII
jgi:hypothetical protein